jgi:hypothetical protein
MTVEQKYIQELAYQFWEQRGRPEGSSEQDWLSAETQLNVSAASAAAHSSVDQALEDSFPASDPPASHLPDEPPINSKLRTERVRAPLRR